MSPELESLIVVLGDESVPMEHRILHALTHQARKLDRIEELLMGIQQDIDAGVERLSTATNAIEAKLGEPAETVDLTGFNAAVDRVEQVAASTAPAPPAEPPASVTTDQFQPLYVVDGDANTDESLWVPFTGYTTPDGHPLFTYVNDTPAVGSAASGDGVAGVWHHYVGELIATV